MDVTVVIPTYNRLWSLPRAVDSCRGTRCAVEIVVVDDGSSDRTGEWLAMQPGVRSLRQDNWGKDWAVNAGFAAARGEYVRFLDSDDWLLPGAIDRQHGLAQAEASDVVVGGYQLHDEHEALLRSQPWVRCDDFIAQQIGECDSSHYGAYLYRRDFVAAIPHRPEFGALDDRMFAIEVAIAQPKVSIVEEPTIGLRHHDRERLQFARGARAVATNLQHVTVYRKAMALLASRGMLTERRAHAATPALWRLARAIARTHPAEARDVVRWIHELDPRFQPPESGLLALAYRRIGFTATERLLRLRRTAVGLVTANGRPS